MKSLANGCKLGALGAAGRLSVLLVTLAASVSVHAAQVVNPIHVSGGNRAPGDNLSTGSITVGAGTSFTFDVRYEVTSPQTANEAGLGLKLRYDASKFDNVNVTPVNAAGGNFTDVTQVLTKCIVAAPSDQAGTYSSPSFTTPREVIFGWLDTSVRTGGAVGWPGSADGSPACLNPGFTTNTAAVSLPATLFRITMKTKSTFTSGNTQIVLTADGNVSYANSSPGMTDKTISIQGAPAPTCNLDADGDGQLTALRDGVLIVRNMLGISGSGFTAGISFNSSATRTTEAAIKSFLNSHVYDADGSGSQQALVDGVILVRLMLGISNAALLNGINLPSSAVHTSAAAIRAHVNSLCGTNF